MIILSARILILFALCRCFSGGDAFVPAENFANLRVRAGIVLFSIIRQHQIIVARESRAMLRHILTHEVRIFVLMKRSA